MVEMKYADIIKSGGLDKSLKIQFSLVFVVEVLKLPLITSQ